MTTATRTRTRKAPAKASSPKRSSNPVAAWPSLRRAAEILLVDVSSLSRSDIRTERMGREKRVPPAVVLERAAYYQRRSLDEVAGALVQVALDQASGQAVESVEVEVEQTLRRLRGGVKPDSPEWLEEARAALPPELFEEVQATVRRGSKHPGLRGSRPAGRG